MAYQPENKDRSSRKNQTEQQLLEKIAALDPEHPDEALLDEYLRAMESQPQEDNQEKEETRAAFAAFRDAHAQYFAPEETEAEQEQEPGEEIAALTAELAREQGTTPEELIRLCQSAAQKLPPQSENARLAQALIALWEANRTQTKKPRKKTFRQTLRVLLVAAILTAIVVAYAMPAAGFNPLKSVVDWDSHSFSFYYNKNTQKKMEETKAQRKEAADKEPQTEEIIYHDDTSLAEDGAKIPQDTTITYTVEADTIQEVMSECGIGARLFPTWLPERFRTREPFRVTEDRLEGTFDFREVYIYPNRETGDQTFYAFSSFMSPGSSWSNIYKDEREPILYTVHGVDYYIIRYLDQVKVVAETGNYCVQFIGEGFTVEEMKQCIDSIYADTENNEN